MQFKQNVSLRDKTSFRIGGPARWYLEPADEETIIAALDQARQESIPVMVFGRGSNLLVADTGWPGLAMVIGPAFSAIEWSCDAAIAQAGALLDTVVREAIARGLAGMEELSGIPGSVGGAVIMNAGAFSASIADTIQGATWLAGASLQIVNGDKESLGLGYRTSALKGTGAVVLSAQFRFHPGEAEKLLEARRSILDRRKEKQPIDLPNCGSVFKRPPGNFAGTLIENAGLKGFRFGNAEISAKHANFIVNLGGATAAEVRHLIVIAQRRVYEMSGILLKQNGPIAVPSACFDL